MTLMYYDDAVVCVRAGRGDQRPLLVEVLNEHGFYADSCYRWSQVAPIIEVARAALALEESIHHG